MPTRRRRRRCWRQRALPDPGGGDLQGSVGVNVASDALANLASSGVTAGRW
jgi:hypothetical protein